MTDAIIVGIVAVLFLIGIRGTWKHFRGEGGCCGGGGTVKEKIPRKELQGKKLGEKVLHVSGMHCDHCVARLTKEINKIDGVSAKVSLKKGTAIVSYDREIEDQLLKEAVEKLGFTLRD